MPKLIDLTGNKYGKLIVLEKAPSKNKKVMWLCQCECGTIKEIRGEHLKSGSVISCGCYHKNMVKTQLPAAAHNNKKNWEGEKKGHLKILKATENRASNGGIIWECKCDCGNIVFKSTSDLSAIKGCHCGCQTINSLGELKINQILTQAKIPFIQQKIFTDCRFIDTDTPARFDFYVNNSYIIEYDGKQHFEYNDNIKHRFNKNSFEKTKQHDDIKNEYCKANNIPIIRIPYTHYNQLCLEDLLLETSNFIL